jgi:TonB family protein
VRSPWLASLFIHSAAALALALALGAFRRHKQIENIEIQVYESPRLAPPSLDLSQQRPKKTAPPREAEARKVFGVARDALSSAEGPAVKAGNTLAKAPDRELLRPGDEKSLPIPTDEYLVSEMPSPIGELRIPYPQDAKAKGLSGPVVMSLLIDEEGLVRDAALVSGAGGGLDEAALAAVRGLRFRPAKAQGKPVCVRIKYTHRFILESA